MSRFLQNAYLYPILLAMASVNGILPLRDQWRAGCEALAAGEPRRALTLFREFDHWYAGEAAVAEAAFSESRIRLWALAALESGSLEEAATLLERWLAENPDQQRFRAFLRYQLAELHTALGNPEAAEAHRQQFIQEHPELPECILIHWSRADEALARKDTEAARAHMEAVLRHPRLPTSGHSLAGAAMAAISMAEGNQTDALEQLSRDAAHEEDPILDLWRSLMAPSLVQQLLGAEEAEAARTAAGWFDKPVNLRERLTAFRQTHVASPSRPNVRQALWNRRWGGQLNHLQAALEQVTASMADTGTLYALRLRAFLKTQAFRDAAILGRALVESPGALGPDLRAQAYRETIEAFLQLKEWEAAEAYTRRFLEAHPEDPALPDILFMNARTAAARKDFPAALDQVALLIAQYPGHPACLSWKVLQATWLLAAGQPQEALEVFKACSTGIPPAWEAFIHFQTGRCREALKELDAAAERYRAVAGRGDAAASLREAAHTALLKLHFRRNNAGAFLQSLNSYRERWPAGMNQLIVENLAGSYHRRSGEHEKAIRIFKKVAEHSHPAAGFARSQLSSLYRESNDMPALRRHALRWIARVLGDGSTLPADPFLDLRHFREQTDAPALPPETLRTLLEAVETGDQRLSTAAFFDLLNDDWDACRGLVAPEAASMQGWIEARAAAHHATENKAAFAVYQLHAARMIEAQGRTDSADARRIQVIQSVPPRILGEVSLFTVARTAHAYDFPEKTNLLESFLIRFPDSGLRPEALFLLAGIHRTEGKTAEAVGFLKRILADWPDAGIHDEACLQLAAWHLDDGNPEAALAVLDTLLAAPRLLPVKTATALLYRARADFQTDRPDRGVLNVFRILSLYPDFHDTVNSALGLLLGHMQNLEDHSRREDLLKRLRTTAPEDVLSRFQIPLA